MARGENIRCRADLANDPRFRNVVLDFEYVFQLFAELATWDINGFNEAVEDRVNSLITAGTDLTATYDDADGTLTLDVDLSAPQAIGGTTPNAGTFTDLTVDTSFTLTYPGQDWKLLGDGVNLEFQGQTSANAAEIELASMDNDGTDDVYWAIDPIGNEGSSDFEIGRFGWNAANSRYEINFRAQGTGSLRNFAIVMGSTAALTVDTSGNMTPGGTFDGRDVAADGLKLDGIESGATADQTDAEIETAYNNQVSVVSQAEAEAGTSTTVRRWTAQRVKQAIDALAGSSSGDVTGPASSTDNAITRFDGTGGKTIQNSDATLDDTGLLTVTELSVSKDAVSLGVPTKARVADTGAASNEKNWNFQADNGTLKLVAENDAKSAETTAFDVTRSGQTPSAFNFRLDVNTNGNDLSLGAGALNFASGSLGEVATQAEMETGTAVNRAVTPGRQHYHPGHPKAWVTFDGTGTVAILEDYGVSSITDNATGDWNVNWDTSFSSVNYCMLGMSQGAGFLDRLSTGTTVSSGQVRLFSHAGSQFDSDFVHVAAMGDQ